MKIIVTGGSGFLGRHLIQALIKNQHIVLNIDLVNSPDSVTTTIADVRDTSLMKKYIKNADLVFHLASKIEAGESVLDPQKYIENNILGTINILEAMRQNGISKFIFSSSAAVYGDPVQIPIQEDDRTLPVNPYGMSKLAMEGLLSSYVKNFNFSGIALRYFNLYGPQELHQPETHAIPRFIQQIYNNQPLTFWGDGEYIRDFIYIADVVQAHLKSIDFINNQPQKYHYFNLSSNSQISIKQLAFLIAKIMGKKISINYHPPRLGDPRVLVANAEKAKKMLNWQAVTNLNTGLKQTIAYFEKRWQS